MSSLLSLSLWCMGVMILILISWLPCDSVDGWLFQFPYQFPQHSTLLPLSSATRRTTITTVTTTTMAMAMATTHTALLSTAAAAAAMSEHEPDEPTDHASITALPFPLDVFDFLNKSQISWNKVDTDTDNDDNNDNNTDRHMILGVRTIPHHHHVIVLHRRSNNTTVGRGVLLLHLIPTPTTLEEAMEPHFNKQWTDHLCSLRDNVDNDDNDYDDTNDDDGDSVIPDKVIHLHQDIWEAPSKQLIVQSRILAQVGMTQRRIFARKTTAKRINATAALSILHHHHLWDATRSKYYYGLVLGKEDDKEELVAVATFSSRRKVRRNKQVFRSHELIRFCSLRESTVVGGISKLLKKFIQEQQPDDIITVVDRDWGDGSGWHHKSLGFETVAIMDPIVMAVNPHEKGVRRQLVGAGISPTTTTTTATSSNDDIDNGRIGLPIGTWNKLNSMNTTTATDANNHTQALEYLANDHYYPVYDSGVERLFKVVVNVNTSQSSSPQSNQQQQQKEVLLSGQELWHHSTPKYADTYYSPNPGISSLLEFAARSSVVAALSSSSSSTSSSVVSHPLFSPPTTLPPPPIKFEEENIRTMASWHATSGTAASAQFVFSAPSSLDPTLTVEVRQRANGWHTVGIVSGERGSSSDGAITDDDDDDDDDGSTKKKKKKKKTTATSIYHGIYKVDENTNVIESNKVVSEYIKTMATLALSGLEAVAATNTNGTSTSTTTTTTVQRKPPYRFLHYGYGAGTLVRFLAQYCDPSSEHVVLELDSGVVAAADNFIQTQLSSVLSTRNNNTVQLQLGDAVTYHQQYHNRTMQQQEEKQSTQDNDDDKRKQQSSLSSSSSSVLFDCILIDVFDEQNQVPKELYSPQFLSGLSQNLLTPNGIIVHNFHSGGRRHTQVCQEAAAAYSTVFGGRRRSRRGEEHNNNNNNNKGDDNDNDDGCCFWVDSLDSKPNAGNVIVLASKSSFLHRSNSPTTTTFEAKSENDDDSNTRNATTCTKSTTCSEKEDIVMIYGDKNQDDDVLTRCARTIQTKYNFPFDAAVRVSPERRKTEF